MADAEDKIELHRVISPSETLRELLNELDEELMKGYRPDQRHAISLEAIFEPYMRFYIASLNREPAGCGGVALFPKFAELKRMYVKPEFRGRGIAEKIVEKVSEDAKNHRLNLLRLETGNVQHAAIRFYKRMGFATCGPFEPYASKPIESISTSVFMEKCI